MEKETTMKVTRREVLCAAAGAALTLALPSNLLSGEPPVESLSFYTERLAKALGGEKEAGSIKEYYDQTAPIYKAELEYVNGQMRQAGFTDFGRSSVYRVGGNVFYAVVFKDGFNVCMPFMAQQKIQKQAQQGDNLIQDANRGNQFIGQQVMPKAMIEGPTVIALARASEDIRKDVDAPTAVAYLMPRQRLSSSEGSFESGYVQPDVYITEAGTVKIDYDRTSRGRGRAHVTVVRGETREVVFDKKYDIRYVP